MLRAYPCLPEIAVKIEFIAVNTHAYMHLTSETMCN